jgi:hypothetical protein
MQTTTVPCFEEVLAIDKTVVVNENGGASKCTQNYRIPQETRIVSIQRPVSPNAMGGKDKQHVVISLIGILDTVVAPSLYNRCLP